MMKKIDAHVENVDLEDLHESQKGAAPLTNANKDLTDLQNEVRAPPRPSSFPLRLDADPRSASALATRRSSPTSTRSSSAGPHSPPLHPSPPCPTLYP